VLVVCRFRPLNKKELQLGSKACVEFAADKKTVTVKLNGSVRHTYGVMFTVGRMLDWQQ
jgi:hypothetical protein